MMIINKHFIIRLIICIVLLCPNSCNAAETYNIDAFDSTTSGLINHDPGFLNGDTLNIINNLNATKNIGHIQNGNLNINGFYNTLNGSSTYSGFLVNMGETLNLKNYGSVIFSRDGSYVIQESINNFLGTSGSVITNTGTLNIINSVFTGNTATANGGVLSNTTIMSISNSFFSNNSAQKGGAISSRNGIINISDGTKFINNTAGENGGAIYDSLGRINITANNTNVEFTGNKANNTSNAIYVENYGQLNLNAGSAEVIINDGIKVAEGTIQINNGDPNTTPTSGRISLNNILSSIDGNDVPMSLNNSGTLKLGTYINGSQTSYGQIGSIVVPIYNLILKDTSVLDLANGRPSDTVFVKDLTVSGTPQVMIDVNLTDSLSDKIKISGTGTGTSPNILNFYNFKLSNDSNDTKQFTVLEGTSFPEIAVAPKTYTNSTVYNVTANNNGQITFEKDLTQSLPTDGLQLALSDNGERSFSLINNYEALTSDLNPLQHGKLTVFGQDKNYYISGGSNHSLFQVGGGTTLNIYDTVITDASKTSAILNNGDLNIYNSEINGSDGSTQGSAIYTTSIGGTVNSVKIYNSGFSGNQSGIGGAINSLQSDVKIYNSTFYGNGGTAEGGAIYNQGPMKIYNSYFELNTSPEGGAINNHGELAIENSTFYNNTGKLGGAIASDTVVLNIKNTDFKKNIVGPSNGSDGAGGAIYLNNATVNLVADGGNITFSENTANGISNAIHANGTSKINLNAGNGQITFNDRITSSGNNNVININQSGGNDEVLPNSPTNGTVVLNNNMTGFGNNNSTTGNNVNLYNGTLALGENATFFNNAAFNMYNTSTLDLRNNGTETVHMSNFNVNGNSSLHLDVDLANSVGDYITADNVGGSGTLTVKGLNLLSHANASTIDITDSTSGLAGKISLDASLSQVKTPIYLYDVSYDNALGKLNFAGTSLTGGFNPDVLAGPVAAQAGSYLTQINSYLNAFGNMDMIMLMPKAQRQALKYRNLYAATDERNPMVFSPTFIPEEKKGLWLRPFTTFESVPLNNGGPTVSNVLYGTLVGFDSDIKDLGKGYEGVFSGYFGYNGSHQNYNNVGIYQNGGLLGLTGALYKDNFFGAITANVGANNAEASTSYGNDNFTMLATGIAAKAGYNWELGEGKYVIQPSYLMSYTFVNTFNYTNSAGLNINSEPLNAIQIAPGLKFICNLKNHWQPYAAVNMVWNIIDKTRFQANDVSLPNLSVAPYFEYGLGVQKKWGERFTGFAQTMFRGGGRNGIALSFGLRWTI